MMESSYCSPPVSLSQVPCTCYEWPRTTCPLHTLFGVEDERLCPSSHPPTRPSPWLALLQVVEVEMPRNLSPVFWLSSNGEGQPLHSCKISKYASASWSSKQITYNAEAAARAGDHPATLPCFSMHLACIASGIRYRSMQGASLGVVFDTPPNQPLRSRCSLQLVSRPCVSVASGV